MEQGCRVAVVSGDGMIQSLALGMGALRVTPRSFCGRWNALPRRCSVSSLPVENELASWTGRMHGQWPSWNGCAGNRKGSAMEHFERFRDLEDDELVLLAREDDDALTYLMLKYKNLVRAKARSYFLMGADSEDILQEGMMGLYKAIRDYKPEMSSFRGFAELCVTRQIISAVKTATRQKHMPLNSYVSLNKPVYDADDRTLLT